MVKNKFVLRKLLVPGSPKKNHLPRIRKLYLKGSLVFASFLFSSIASAGQNLREQCDNYSHGTYLRSDLIDNYNLSTLGEDSEHIGMNIHLHNDGGWYYISYDQKSFRYFDDMVKTAFLTSYYVESCVNTFGGFLLGLEWSAQPDAQRDATLKNAINPSQNG